MTRLRQAGLLVGPSLRTVAWPALVPAALLGLAILQLDGDRVVLLRLAAVALCVAAAFALDDPAAETTAAAPAPLLFRRALRLALVLPLVGVAWALLLGAGGPVPEGGLTLELAAMLAFALAASAWAAAYVADGRGGLAAAPVLLVALAAAAIALPERWTLFAGAADPRWTAAHARWTAVLVLALLALLAASVDPGRPRILARLRPRRAVVARDAAPERP